MDRFPADQLGYRKLPNFSANNPSIKICPAFR